MLFIEVPDMNDSMSDITIDGEDYLLRFTYNETDDSWSFGIYKDEYTPLAAMVKIVPNFPLFHYYKSKKLPDGVWGCLSRMDHIGRFSFVDGDADFVYIPNADLKEE